MNGDLRDQIHKTDMNLGPSATIEEEGSFTLVVCWRFQRNHLAIKKKQGGRSRPNTQMQLFNNILDECDFMDLGFVGFPFTWHKHYADFTVWEKLDKTMATNEWFTMFPGTKKFTTWIQQLLIINLCG